ncbi:MAG: DEAD/DEAH box helicase [archaeon]
MNINELDNMKSGLEKVVCYVEKKEDKFLFIFPEIDKDTLNNILKYKSWEFSTWNNPNTEMVNYVKTYKDEYGSTVIETKDGLGFAPTLVKHLKGLGYILLKPNGSKFSLAENCKTIKIPHFKFKLRDYQMDCYLKWSRDKLGVVKSPTGSGKTVIGAYAIKETKYKTLILVHTLDLVELWYNSLSKSFGFGFTNRTGIFGGNKKIEDCIHKDIIIGTYQSALKEKNMEYLKGAGFGFALLDECHHVPAQTFKKVVNSMNIPYKMGLSATPKRLDGREGDIYALLDNIKANVSLSQLIKRGHVVKPYFYNVPVIDNEVASAVASSGKKGLAKAQMLKQLSSQSKVKIKKMMRLVNDFIDEDETFLIFADFIESAQIIEEVINEYLCKPKKNCFKSVPRVDQKMNSETRNDLFNNVGYKYQGLIFAKLGSEGIDIPKIDNIIILSPSKSPTTFSQRVGRSLRPDKGKKYSKVFQFVLKNTKEEDWKDYSFEEYRNEGFLPKNIDIPEME